MSSSDSEDDCYGNVVQKLQSIKSAYQSSVPECTKTSNSQNDSLSVEKTSKTESKQPESGVADANTSIISTDNDEFLLDAIIANNTIKPKTRGKRKNSEENYVDANSSRVTRSCRRKTAPTTQEPLVTACQPVTAQDNQVNSEVPSRRGRGRGSRARGNNTRASGRSRASNSRTTSRPPPQELYPTYSVGNTDEYPDTCDNQQLFATSSNNDVVLLEEGDPLDDNEELSVKVYWQSIEVFKFKIRKFQKLTQIFDHFSKKENVGNDRLLFTYNDRILKVDDTPDTIDYNIAKFIDGGIVKQNVTDLVKTTERPTVNSGIKLKFQCQNVKKLYETRIGREDKLVLAMTKYAEHIEIPLERLKFYFDGDLISGKSTAVDLDLEGGECIDVKLTS